MAFNATGFIDGTTVPASLLRRQLWASTGGETGIVRPSDLQVRATASPTPTVLVYAGGCVVSAKPYAGWSSQSYLVTNDSAVTVDVPPNNTSDPVIWYLILRVQDPQYAGRSTPLTDAFLTRDPNGHADLMPTYRLARITLPPNTSRVTDAMIDDLREMVQPRRRRFIRSYQTDKTSDTIHQVGKYEWFPTGARWDVEIPDWATKAIMVGTWAQVHMLGDNGWEGWLRVGIDCDGDSTATHVVLAGGTDASSAHSRETFVNADTLDIPPHWRGRTATVQLQGLSLYGGGSAYKPPIFDPRSAAVLDIEWLEAPMQDQI